MLQQHYGTVDAMMRFSSHIYYCLRYTAPTEPDIFLHEARTNHSYRDLGDRRARDFPSDAVTLPHNLLLLVPLFFLGIDKSPHN